MAQWKKILHTYAFCPQQQFLHTSGLTLWDLLHSRTISGFCIVSTNSNFTRLAIRIREEGLFVMGIGKPETPESFVRSCEVFVYTTNLISEQKEGQKAATHNKDSEDSRQGLKNWSCKGCILVRCLSAAQVSSP